MIERSIDKLMYEGKPHNVDFDEFPFYGDVGSQIAVIQILYKQVNNQQKKAWTKNVEEILDQANP